jgi:hypothetical protein
MQSGKEKIMKEYYPLKCDVCMEFHPVYERKMYELVVSEVLPDETDSKYSYKKGDFRQLQICEVCFENSDINKLLIRDNRKFR